MRCHDSHFGTVETPVSGARTGTGGSRRAFTLVESIVSMAIVGLLLVAALNAVGQSRHAQLVTSEQERGHALAQQMMAEILQQAYVDPTTPTAVLGPESDEKTGDRIRYDDVDDYNGWSVSPPQSRDGTAWSELSGWRCTVSVDWINPVKLTETANYDTGLKRITVTVICQNRRIVTLTALRTRAWPMDGTQP